jgi:hypothetical protein
MYLDRTLRSIGIFLASACLPLGFAYGETLNCTAITVLPSVITTPGVYCLTGDLFTSMTIGYAIDIQANTVTIDLNGHRLGGGSAGVNTLAWGIHSLDRNNVTIKNGTIKGFGHGIVLRDNTLDFTGSGGHLIEELRLDHNMIAGIHVQGKGNIVRNNQIASTGLSPLATDAYGIVTYGPGAQILNNSVFDTQIIGNSAYGIRVGQGSGVVVQNNRVMNISVSSVVTFGITAASGVTQLAVRDNTIANMWMGVILEGNAALPVAKNGVCMGNIVLGVDWVTYTCVKAGFNFP